MEKNKFIKSSSPDPNQFIKESSGYLYLKETGENNDDYYFEGVASSYGNIDQQGDIFLEGSLDSNLGKSVAIMTNHSWDITKAIGAGTLEKDGDKILIKGNFIKNDEIAEKIVTLKKNKVPLKLSIGGIIKEAKPYKHKGNTYRGISKAEIYEVSVVFMGANPNASITKNIDNTEEENMEKLLKELQDLKAALTKAVTTEEKETFEKKLTELYAKIEQLGISEDEKNKISKIADLENKIAKMEDALDKMVKDNKTNINSNAEYTKELEKELNTYVKTGVVGEKIKKTLTTASGSGGALLPETRVKEIIKEISETSPFYEKARKYSTSGDSLKIRVKVNGTNNAHNQEEGAAAGTQSGATYKFLELKVGKITDDQAITQEMIDDSEFDAFKEVMEDSKENIAEKIAADIWNGEGGTGNNEFYGVYKDATVTSAALEGELTWANIVKLIYEIPKKIRAKSEFIVSTEALETMRTWTDKNGRPLYTESLVVGEPGTFSGYQVTEDPYMDEVAEEKYPVFFGVPKDFYAVLHRKEITLERMRDADKDLFVCYTRTRQGGKVRQASSGKLLKIKKDSE